MQSDYRLGDWLIRPRLDRIERGEESVHLKPKAMAVLGRLARANGEVVTRNELFDAVWPGATVSDAVLTQCIVELRHALGDSAQDPEYIETIPKVGFRLVAAVESADPGERPHLPPARETQPPTARRTVVAVLSSTLVLILVVASIAANRTASENAPPEASASAVDDRSLAVLPFIDASANLDQAWFADGLAAELITRLAGIPELKVTGQTSSFRFRGSSHSPQAIANTLRVRYLLEGSVQKSGQRMRVTATLVDAQTGFNVWSERFDRPYAELIAVQDEISESVLTALSVSLKVGQMAGIEGGTRNVEAFEAYQRAWQLFARTAEEHLEGIRLLERAVDLDPRFARAWTALSTFNHYGPLMVADAFPIDWFERAEAALDTARRLTPDSPIVLAVSIDLHQKRFEWAEIDRLVAQADPESLELHPTVLFSRGIALMMTGRVEEAVDVLERARMLAPLRPDIAAQLAHAYLLHGRVAESLAEFERAWTLSESPSWTHAAIGLEAALSGRDAVEIRKWFDRMVRHARAREHPFLATLHQRLDDPVATGAILREAFDEHDPFGMPDYWIANFAAFIGETDLAIEAMLRTPDPYGIWTPLMADVRRHPGFVELVDRLGLLAYWREHGWNGPCRPSGPDGLQCDPLTD